MHRLQRWATWAMASVLLGCGALREMGPPAPPPDAERRLAGVWAVEQFAYIARRALPDSVQERLHHSPAAATNHDLRTGQLQLLLELRPNRTFTYREERPNQPPYAEQGTWLLRRDTLRATTAAGDTATIDGQAVMRLKGSVLLTEVGVLAPHWQVAQQTRYRRVR